MQVTVHVTIVDGPQAWPNA